MKKINKVAEATLCLFIFMFFSINVNAQEVVRNKFSGEFSAPVIGYDQIIIAVLFLAIFIVIALFFIKKLRINNVNSQGILDVIYSYPISAKEKLLIVKAAHEYLLLSSSSAGLRKIHVLEQEYMDDMEISKSTGANDFANVFANYLSKKNHA